MSDAFGNDWGSFGSSAALPDLRHSVDNRLKAVRMAARFLARLEREKEIFEQEVAVEGDAAAERSLSRLRTWLDTLPFKL